MKEWIILALQGWMCAVVLGGKKWSIILESSWELMCVATLSKKSKMWQLVLVLRMVQFSSVCSKTQLNHFFQFQFQFSFFRAKTELNWNWTGIETSMLKFVQIILFFIYNDLLINYVTLPPTLQAHTDSNCLAPKLHLSFGTRSTPPEKTRSTGTLVAK